MADTATMSLSATILPDDIAKTLTGLTMAYTPLDNAEGWFFKVANIDSTSAHLLTTDKFLTKTTGGGSGGHVAGRGVASDTALNSMVIAEDKVKFLFIKHNSVCLLYTSPSPRDQRG